jgi:site-specific DNA-methyltransferase (adenine-specific)
MTPYYEEPGVTIYHADCRDVLPTLPKVDVVITDPPYGINHPTNYAERGRSALAQCANYPPVFGDSRPFDPSPWLRWPCVLFGGNHFAERLPNASGWIVWDKWRPEELDQATAELAWSNCIKGVRVFRFLWNGMIRASDEPLEHPTQKPVALMAWILGLRWTPPGAVLDPFMGSGTTLVAAKRLGRRAIGIEIEERYCEIAARRVQEASMPLFDDAPAAEQWALSL